MNDAYLRELAHAEDLEPIDFDVDLLRSRCGTGSYLVQGRLPQLGEFAYTINHITGETDCGAIAAVYDIDGHGLANTYVDLLADDGFTAHTSVAALFDHEPELTLQHDDYGDCHVWL